MSRRWLMPLVVVLVGAADPPAGYTPVASPRAVPLAAQAQLAAIRDWVEDRDYASAAEGVRGLEVLAHLAAYQSPAADWRQEAAALGEACSLLAAAVKSKDAGRCTAALDECAKRLATLARREPPTGPAPDYRPQGSTKTWMQLLDGAYLEAKTARSPADLAAHALALAEVANAMAYLRSEPRWRQLSVDLRDAARQAGQPAADLPAARSVLKNVYQRCEACHQAYRR
jgi:hypothetical protein